jgi:FtsP/CotA-like multicopper oxidase with cupredoxin domain
MVPTNVRWINDLKDPATGNFIPHLFNVDQTLHWANPPKANCVTGDPNRTDCDTEVPTPYTGPVPLVTHLHGDHIQPHSDGYPEAWWLPAASNIPAGYASRGTHYTQADNSNSFPGSAYYSYENSQPATTVWYHDHAMGMTRLNVYAGPAGFWLIRGGAYDTQAGVLPGPAPTIAGGDPNFNSQVRQTIREVPLAIQDRSFNSDGTLFYPVDRSFFDGFTGPYIGGTGTPGGPSDIAGIWNPEAFFNTMVVNGTTWPKYEVKDVRYRLRLLNGCNSRTLNLALFTVTSIGADQTPGTNDDVLGAEVPIYQIGTEQGFLRQVVMITTGFATPLPGNGTIPPPVAAPTPEQALLMGSAERADIIVDFGGMANGTRIRMINTAPDAPFGGFPDVPADPLTTGQVMDFIVNTALPAQPTDTSSTQPQNLVLPAEAPLGVENAIRQVSLNELSSDQVCVEIDPLSGAIIGTLFSTVAGDPTFLTTCAAAPVAPGNVAEPMGPRQARLGTVTTSLGGNLVAEPTMWREAITELPRLNDTEIWEIFNTTADAHPIHLHLVRFEVVNREDLNAAELLAGNLVPTGVTYPPNPNEIGYKDTVLAFPGQLTRIKAKFDIAGLYLWHCHIVEHEDNEMMRPFIVTAPATGVTLTPDIVSPQLSGTPITFTAAASGGAEPYQYRFWVNSGTGFNIVQDYSTAGTFPWVPSAAGAYDILVDARSAGSTAFREASTKLFYYQITPAAATGVTLTPNAASPQPLGTPITLTAAGQGGSGTYEYRFWVNSGSGFSMVRDYSAANTYNWTPAATGAYDILVDVRSAGSTASREALTKLFYYQIVTPPATGVTLTPDLASPQAPSTPITFTAAGQGGTGTYEYRFWVNSGSGFSIVQDYSAVSTFPWTPAATGAYDFLVDVRNAGSTAFREAFTKYFYYRIQ